MVDWSSAGFPPWWNQKAAERRALLDGAVTRLRCAVASSRDIVGALVFGSYAAGTVGPESDLDVMLVTTIPAGADPGLRYARLVQRLALGVPCDLLIYEPQEFEQLTRERPFVAQARRDGIWIDAAAPA